MDDIIITDTLGNASTLTGAINLLPAEAGKLGKRGLFTGKGVATTTISLAMMKNRLRIIGDSERGENVAPTKREKRQGKKIDLLHFVETGELLPGALQDVVQFGGNTLQNAKMETINDELLRMKRNLETTREFHRVGAVQGIIRDADGSVIYNLYDLFDVEQRTVQFLADDAKTIARQFFTKLLRDSEAEAGGLLVSHWECMAGKEVFDAITNHKSVAPIYQGYLEAKDRLGGDVRSGFQIGGVTLWDYNLKIDGVDFVKPNEAHMYPVAPEAYLERFGPADWNEAVGTMGLEYYTRAEPRKMGKGWDLESQTNPVALCTVPGALTKITLG